MSIPLIRVPTSSDDGKAFINPLRIQYVYNVKDHPRRCIVVFGKDDTLVVDLKAEELFEEIFVQE